MGLFLNFLWPQKEPQFLNTIEKESNLKTSKLQFWTLIGPFFLFLIFFLFLSSNELLLAISLASLFLCWRFGRNGFFISLAALLLAMFYHHIFLSSHLWQLGIEAYVGLAIFMVYLGFEETFKLENKYKSAIRENQIIRKKEQEKFTEQKRLLQKEIDTLSQQLKYKSEHFLSVSDKLQSLKKLNDVLCNCKELNEESRKELEAKIRNQNETIFRLQDELTETQKELTVFQDSAALKKRNLELLTALNQTRIEKHQAYLINEALAQYYNQKISQQVEDIAKPKQDEMPKPEKASLKEQVKTLDDKAIYYHKIETDFAQLRRQFDEKNEVLYLTRKEVFNLQTQVSCLQNTLEEKELEQPSEEKRLMQMIQELERNCEVLEQENKTLEQFCETLLREKNEN